MLGCARRVAAEARASVGKIWHCVSQSAETRAIPLNVTHLSQTGSAWCALAAWTPHSLRRVIACIRGGRYGFTTWGQGLSSGTPNWAEKNLSGVRNAPASVRNGFYFSKALIIYKNRARRGIAGCFSGNIVEKLVDQHWRSW